MKRNILTTLLLSAVVAAFIALAGCDRQGPAEKAGEKIDEAVESAREAVEKANERIEETVESAKESVNSRTEE